MKPGKRLGRFDVVELIGAGGMGEVYRARDPELERDVAIKILPPGLAADVDRIRRLEQEARSIARIAHPNLLAIHDIGRLDDTVFLVFELLDGKTLRERLASGPLPVREALDIAVQVADGLAAAHEAGLVHRDLKPENVFVCADGHVKVLDFGLAAPVPPTGNDADELSTVSTLSADAAVAGTLAYMAPEQASGGVVDHRSDQFALGVMLFELLTGRRPFAGSTPQETLASILRDEPEALEHAAPHVPAPVRWAVGRCLSRAPGGRYDSTADLGRELRTIADRLPELTRISGPPPEPSRLRRLSAPAAALTAVAAAAAAAAMLLALRTDPAGSLAEYQRITFRRGTVTAARFDPTGESVLYSASWDGEPGRVFLHRPEGFDPLVVGPTDSRLVSISPRGELLLVTGLSAIGPFLNTGTLVRMPVTGAPRIVAPSVSDAAFGPDGELGAIVREDDGTAVLEFPPGTDRITTRGMFLGLALSPSGDRLAFAHAAQRGHDWGAIELLGREGDPVRLDVEAGRGLVWAPAGNELWFVPKSATNRLDAVDPDGRTRAVAAFPGSVFLYDVSPDGRVLLGTEERRFEMAGRAPGGEERDLSWLSWSVPFDLSLDGTTILFNECEQLRHQCRPSLRGFGDAPPVVLDRHGFGVSLSRDGEWVLSAPPWSPRELEMIATRSEDRRGFVIRDIEGIDLATWSPDGLGVFFSGSVPGESNRVFRFDLETEATVPVTPEGVEFGLFAVSPDGSRVAVPRVEGGISVVPLDGGRPRTLQIEGQPIRFSADGRFLYTAPLGEVPGSLHRVDLSTGEAQPVATLLPRDPAGVVQVSPVAVTPDGGSYVYGYLRRLSVLWSVDGLAEPRRH